MAGRRMKPFLSFATLIFLFFCYPTQSSSLIAYDCTTNTTTCENVTIPIEDFLSPCETLKDLETFQAAVVEVHGSRKAVAYQCKVTFTQQLVDNRGAVQNITITEIITRDACLKAHETKTIDLAGHHITFLKTNGTINYSADIEGTNYAIDNEVSSGGPRNQSVVRHYTITLSEYDATVDLSKNMIFLQNDLVCDYDWFNCQDDYGQVFWRGSQLTDPPFFWGNVSFTVSDGFLNNSGIRYAVFSTISEVYVLKTLYNKVTSFNDWPAFSTEIPNVFIVPSTQAYIRGRDSVKESTLTEAIYSEPFYFGADTVEVSKRRCERENQVRRSILTESPVNSTIAVPEIHSVAIKDENSLFRLSVCETKAVTLRPTKECFQEIPVKDEEGRELFLNPASRFISEKSDSIACDSQPSTTVKPAAPCKKSPVPESVPVKLSMELGPPEYLPEPLPQYRPQKPHSSLASLIEIPLSILAPKLLSSVSRLASLQAGVNVQSQSSASTYPAAHMAPPPNPVVIPEYPSQYPAVPPQYPAVPPQYPAVLPQYPAVPPQYPAVPPQYPAVLPQYPAVPPQYPAVPPQYPVVLPQYPHLPPQYPAVSSTVSQSAFLQAGLGLHDTIVAGIRNFGR